MRWRLNGPAGQAPKALKTWPDAPPEAQKRLAGTAAEAQNACRASPGRTGDPRPTKARRGRGRPLKCLPERAIAPK